MSRRSSVSESGNSQINSFSIPAYNSDLSKKTESKDKFLSKSGNLGSLKEIESLLATANDMLNTDYQTHYVFRKSIAEISSIVLDHKEETITICNSQNSPKAYVILTTNSGKKLLASLTSSKTVTSFKFTDIINSISFDKALAGEKLEVSSVFLASKGFSDKEAYFSKTNESPGNLFDAVYRLQMKDESIIGVTKINPQEFSTETQKFEKIHAQYQSYFPYKDEIYRAQYLTVLTNLFDSQNDGTIVQVDLSREKEDSNPQSFLTLAVGKGEKAELAAQHTIDFMLDAFVVNSKPSSCASSTTASPTRTGRISISPIPE